MPKREASRDPKCKWELRTESHLKVYHPRGVKPSNESFIHLARSMLKIIGAHGLWLTLGLGNTTFLSTFNQAFVRVICVSGQRRLMTTTRCSRARDEAKRVEVHPWQRVSAVARALGPSHPLPSRTLGKNVQASGLELHMFRVPSNLTLSGDFCPVLQRAKRQKALPNKTK